MTTSSTTPPAFANTTGVLPAMGSREGRDPEAHAGGRRQRTERARAIQRRLGRNDSVIRVVQNFRRRKNKSSQSIASCACDAPPNDTHLPLGEPRASVLYDGPMTPHGIPTGALARIFQVRTGSPKATSGSRQIWIRTIHNSLLRIGTPFARGMEPRQRPLSAQFH